MGSFAPFEHYLTTLETETCSEFAAPTMVFWPTVRARPLSPDGSLVLAGRPFSHSQRDAVGPAWRAWRAGARTDRFAGSKCAGVRAARAAAGVVLFQKGFRHFDFVN